MLPVVKRIRLDARKSQETVAKDLEKQVLTIKRWEKGQSEPPFSMICRLVKKYDLNILRYTFSQDDIEELCNRGYAEYALKLEQGYYVPYEMLFALNARDWDTVDALRADKLSTGIADEVWQKVKEDTCPWGETPLEAARAAYSYYENERWEGLAESCAIKKLAAKFQEKSDTHI